MQKRSQFMHRLLAYWTLKRQSRNGVPLLRRLTTSHSRRNSNNNNTVRLTDDKVVTIKDKERIISVSWLFIILYCLYIGYLISDSHFSIWNNSSHEKNHLSSLHLYLFKLIQLTLLNSFLSLHCSLHCVFQCSQTHDTFFIIISYLIFSAMAGSREFERRNQILAETTARLRESPPSLWTHKEEREDEKRACQSVSWIDKNSLPISFDI